MRRASARGAPASAPEDEQRDDSVDRQGSLDDDRRCDAHELDRNDLSGLTRHARRESRPRGAVLRRHTRADLGHTDDCASLTFR